MNPQMGSPTDSQVPWDLSLTHRLVQWVLDQMDGKALPEDIMKGGFNGWKGPYMGGYGCRSCGRHGHGYSSSREHDGGPDFMGGYGCRGCGGRGRGYSPSGGYNGGLDPMGGFNRWKGADVGRYGCRGCGSNGYGYGHDHQYHHHHHQEHLGQGGGRQCGHCGYRGSKRWGPLAESGENGGYSYSAPSDVGSYGYGGYGHDYRVYGYGYGQGGHGYNDF